MFVWEKGIKYVFYLVNLVCNEYVSVWYLGINFCGVVLVFVYDGVVYIESNDILEYFDGLLLKVEFFFF